jgi:glycosyltransferase involved in cell wall biosynthesis
MAQRLRRLGWLGANAAAGGVTAVLYAVVVVPASRIRRFRRRRAGLLPDVLWGPGPILNNRYATRAERLYAYRSDSLVYLVYRINQRGDFDIALDRVRSRPLVGWLVPYGAFLWAGLRYDHFGFFFDGGLLGGPGAGIELPLLRAAGKGVIVYPYGGDARVASETRKRGPWHAYSDIPVGQEDSNEADVRRRLALFGRWADVVLGCADLVEDLPRLDGVLLYPFDSTRWQPVPEVDDGVVTVVHAPNHRHYKGTRFLESAVEQLRAEGLPVELVVVEGMTNEEAKAVFARADIVADQFLLGAYALFAIEAMALGKPVMCFLNDRFRPFHPEWDECPIVSADPDTLTDELRRLVLDPDRRRELGARGPGYVQRHHSLEAVGARLDRIHRELWSR